MGVATDVLRASQRAMAVGRLRDAERGYRWLLAQDLWPAEIAGIARQEIALALAEVLLDQTDGQAFRALYNRWSAQAGPDLWRWEVLAAWRLTEGGFLSLARERWGELLQYLSPGGDPGALAMIRAQRAMVLLQLNRLDEAWDDPTHLSLDGAGGGDAAAWTAWTRSRAWGAGRARTREAIRAAEEGDAGSAPRGTAAGAPARRWEAPPACPRARVWLARLANRVLAALDDGAVDNARELIAAAEEHLARPLDGSLAGRMAWVKGLLRWAEGELAAAVDELTVACDAALRGGLLLDAWNAARAATIVSASLGRDPQAWRRTERDLRERLVSYLTPEDWVFFLGNRGAAVDESLEEVIARAVDTPTALEALHTFQRARWGAVGKDAEAGVGPGQRTGPSSWSRRIWQRLALGRGLSEEPLDLSWIPADAAVVVQAALEREAAAFVATRAGCSVVRAPCARSALIERTEAAIREASARSTRVSPALFSEGSSLGQLARAVGIEAIHAAMGPSVTRVFVMPDGPCVQAPWAALPCHGVPWVERVEIALVPVLRRSRGRWRPARGGAVHGIAAAYDGERGLPFAHDDLTGVASDAWPVTPFEVTTVAEVVRALRGAAGAHCASHGVFDGDDPLSSGILVDGGLLDLATISRLDLPDLALTVLASCWTGAVTQLPGRELFGVPMALHAAGVGAVIAPLWAVSDQFGPGFSRALWHSLGQRDAVGALAATQRRHWRSRHPRLWASWGAWVDGIGVAENGEACSDADDAKDLSGGRSQDGVRHDRAG